VSDATPVVKHPVLYLIACGSRPAADLPDFIAHAQEQGWDVCVIATPTALKFIDAPRMRDLTGHPVRYDYKQPDEPDVLPAPHAYLVAPATFNTINKWASGASDTLALGLINEALGLRMPILAVPFVNRGLAQHPAFIRAIRDLREADVQLIFDPERFPLPVPNQGPTSRELFPWNAVRQQLVVLRGRVHNSAW
jgi:phosphopantothenoylcysteine synthetase/decarboxylase